MAKMSVVCPCCGGTGVRLESRLGFWVAACACCKARTPYKETQSAAIAAWNAVDVCREESESVDNS